jgi:hypothetical protein
MPRRINWLQLHASAARHRRKTAEEKAQIKRDYDAQRRRNHAGQGGMAPLHAFHCAPPPEVLAERDAALANHVDLTALILGDPAPGRSALDRRMAK